MERCDICKELVDYDNPNIHYGGHTCDTSRLDAIGATQRCVGGMRQPYTPMKASSSAREIEEEIADRTKGDAKNKVIHLLTGYMGGGCARDLAEKIDALYKEEHMDKVRKTLNAINQAMR